jgi:uncharacterized membrane protein
VPAAAPVRRATGSAPPCKESPPPRQSRAAMSTDAHTTPVTGEAARRESARDQSKEVARIAAFSDGVFAIAITLLALQLEIPDGRGVDVWHEVVGLRWSFLAFAISFAVIGAYWIAHHRLYAVIDRYDRRLIWLNLLSLFFIVLQPFTTSLVGEHGDSRAAVAIYALSVGFAGLAMTGMAIYALKGRRLCAPDVSERIIKFHIWRGLVIALVFLISLVLLPLGTSVVTLSWLVLIPLQRIVGHRLGTRGVA